MGLCVYSPVRRGERELKRRRAKGSNPEVISSFPFHFFPLLIFFYSFIIIFIINDCLQLDTALNNEHEDSEVHLLRLISSHLRVLIIYEHNNIAGNINNHSMIFIIGIILLKYYYYYKRRRSSKYVEDKYSQQSGRYL